MSSRICYYFFSRKIIVNRDPLLFCTREACLKKLNFRDVLFRVLHSVYPRAPMSKIPAGEPSYPVIRAFIHPTGLLYPTHKVLPEWAWEILDEAERDGERALYITEQDPDFVHVIREFAAAMGSRVEIKADQCYRCGYLFGHWRNCPDEQYMVLHVYCACCAARPQALIIYPDTMLEALGY